jgi:hypothetical protein
MSVRNEERKDLVSSKVKERSRNVYENKGSAFHRPRQSGNVIENTDSYALKAGMSLKLQVVSRCQVVGEGRPVASLLLLALDCRLSWPVRKRGCVEVT